MVGAVMDFNSLIDKLELTKGNLSVHIKILNENKCIKIEKKFIDNKPNTTYSITETGRNFFAEYINMFDKIISPLKTKN